MRCGGQGVYLWFLARELARLGHGVDVFVGPPYPDPMPFARSVTRAAQRAVLGRAGSPRDAAAMLPASRARCAIFEPLNFYELAAQLLRLPARSPSPSACGPSAPWRPGCARASATTSSTTCSASAGAILGLRALGLPVVSTIHHPLTVDRRASFVRDETLSRRARHDDLLPDRHAVVRGAAPRAACSRPRGSARGRSCADFGVRAGAAAHGRATASTPTSSGPTPRVARDARRDPLRRPRRATPTRAIKTLIEALALLPRTVTPHPGGRRPPGQRRRASARGELGCAERLQLVGPRPHRGAGAALPARHAGGGAVALRGLRPARRRGDGLRHAGRGLPRPARCPR